MIANPGGLTAVWAVENSRDAIFEAMRRRETYATSGPRIEVRFFGGWNYPTDMCRKPGFAETGYRKGTPMGGDLPEKPPGAPAPRFAILAVRDQGTEDRPGTPLERVQVVKGWLERGKNPRQKVFEVAGNPYSDASVDLEACERTGHGFDRLCTLWTDPEFDPEERAFYYVRVLENPGCRWNAYECARLLEDKKPDTCTDPEVEKVIRERAWTSPIWYSPTPGKH